MERQLSARQVAQLLAGYRWSLEHIPVPQVALAEMVILCANLERLEAQLRAQEQFAAFEPSAN